MTGDETPWADQHVLRKLYDCPACHQGCAVSYWPSGMTPWTTDPGELPDDAIALFHLPDCPLRPDDG